MGNPPPMYNLNTDLAAKAAAKYDPEREKQAKEWIETILHEPFDPALSFHECLMDGIALCKVINIMMPQNPIKISTSKFPFKKMENIHLFLMRIKDLGVPSFESFQTIDLFEAKNMNQVVDTLFSLSRHAEKKGLQVPRLGPKLATKVERHFSAEVIAQGKAALPLIETLSTKGANQSGIVMGGRREIGGVYLDGPLEEEQPTEETNEYVVVEKEEAQEEEVQVQEETQEVTEEAQEEGQDEVTDEAQEEVQEVQEVKEEVTEEAQEPEEAQVEVTEEAHQVQEEEKKLQEEAQEVEQEEKEVQEAPVAEEDVQEVPVAEEEQEVVPEVQEKEDQEVVVDENVETTFPKEEQELEEPSVTEHILAQDDVEEEEEEPQELVSELVNDMIDAVGVSPIEQKVELDSEFPKEE